MSNPTVFYSLESVGIWPGDAERNTKANAIVYSLPRTVENIARCNAFANGPEIVAALQAILGAKSDADAFVARRKAEALLAKLTVTDRQPISASEPGMSRVADDAPRRGARA